jgi:hypothetical protein
MSRTPSAQSLPVQQSTPRNTSSSRSPDVDYAETPRIDASDSSFDCGDNGNENSGLQDLDVDLGARHVSLQPCSCAAVVVSSQHAS